MIERNNIIEAAEQAFANVRKPKNSACMKVGFLCGVDWFNARHLARCKRTTRRRRTNPIFSD